MYGAIHFGIKLISGTPRPGSSPWCEGVALGGLEDSLAEPAASFNNVLRLFKTFFFNIHILPCACLSENITKQ